MKCVPPSVPDTVMGKEVVSIRAIWDRISFVWPVPAKHRTLFCSTPEMENSRVKNQKFILPYGYPKDLKFRLKTMFPWHLEILFKFLKEWCPISFNFSQAILMICCFSPIVCLLPIPFHWYKPALRALPSNQVIGHKRDLVKPPHHWAAYLILICFSGNYVDNNGRLR